MAGLKDRKKTVAELVKESEEEVAQSEDFRHDEEFDPDRDLRLPNSGPARFMHDMQSKDERVLDELLASIPRSQGYYLKLYKEVLPNKFEYKMRIENYDTWSDLEYEIAQIVIAQTMKFPQRWGSGLYRVVIWKEGGIREREKYRPIDFIVDAGDADKPSLQDGVRGESEREQFNTQLDTLTHLLNAVRQVVPAAPDPAQMQRNYLESFLAGQNAGGNSNNQMMQMFTAMMTAMTSMMGNIIASKNGHSESQPFENQLAKMMEVMKGFGVLGQQNPQKTLPETLAEMKLLGFDPFQKTDPLEQVAKIKGLITSVTDLVPGQGQVKVEKPSIMEKLVEHLAPHIPAAIGNLKSITDNAVLVNQMQEKRAMQYKMEQARAARADREQVPVEERPRTRYGQPVGPQPGRMGAGDAFREEPDMDPYSGFTKPRPPQEGSPEDRGEQVEMFGPQDLMGGADGRPSPAPPQQSAPEQKVHELPPFLQQLYVLVDQNLTNAYPDLYESLMSMPLMAPYMEAAMQGHLPADQICAMLAPYGGPQFNNEKFAPKFKSYLEGFIKWMQDNVLGKLIDAVCDKCGELYKYDSIDRYEQDPEKVCGKELGGNQFCDGKLEVKHDKNKGSQSPS